MDQLHCSPASELTRKKDPTCYSLKALIDIANAYNHSHPNNPIKIRGTKLNIWKAIQQRLFPVCAKDETCWMEQPWIGYNLQAEKYKIFRPEHPKSWLKNDHEWLTNVDIQKSMEQYHAIYPTFSFLGVFPIDFGTRIAGSCISEKLCKVDIPTLNKRDIHQLGAVFNMDRHDQGGSHWVGLYINWKPEHPNYGAFYYDSNGYRIPRQILEFMKNVCEQVNNMYAGRKVPRMNTDWNKKRHQFGNSECGVFSMFFICRCLEGTPFIDIQEGKLYDKYVNRLRKIMFRPPASSVVIGGRGKKK